MLAVDDELQDLHDDSDTDAPIQQDLTPRDAGRGEVVERVRYPEEEHGKGREGERAVWTARE